MKAVLQRRSARAASAAVLGASRKPPGGETRGTTTTTNRFLSSARPLPNDEELYDHLHHHQPVRFKQRRQPPRKPAAPRAPVQARASAVASPDAAVEENTATEQEEDDKKNAAGVPTNESVEDDADEMVSPTSLTYTGDAVIPITSVLQIIKPQDDTPRGVWPVFRLMVRCQK